MEFQILLCSPPRLRGGARGGVKIPFPNALGKGLGDGGYHQSDFGSSARGPITGPASLIMGWSSGVDHFVKAVVL
jgi:hypothetical protein